MRSLWVTWGFHLDTVPNEALYQAEPQPAFVIADSCGSTLSIAAIQWAGPDL
jgi:hypothetical protein